MSADILFLRRPSWAPRWVARLRRVLGYHDVIGHAADVRCAVSELFPDVEWREARVFPSPAARSDRRWLGSGPPDFQFVAGPDDEVTMLFASGVDPAHVRIIEHRMELVATSVYGDGLLDFILG